MKNSRKKDPQILMSFSSMGAYRLNAMSLVKEHFGDRLKIYSGDKASDASIRLVSPADLEHQILKNLFLPFGVVLQNIPIVGFCRARVLVLDLNPRMPHVWIILVLRKMLRKPTLLWGHAFPRKGPKSRSEVVRGVMRNMATGIITYTQTQADELKVLHPTKHVSAAPNALYKNEQFYYDEDSTRDAFIYVGRIVPEKKPLLLIEAFTEVNKMCPEVFLTIIGDGDQFDELVTMVNESPAKGQIRLLGHVDDYQRLATLYSQAMASVSTGYVGLSVTQSLSFGVPMLVSRKEPHAPEIEAIQDGFNALFFESDDVGDLVAKMMGLIQDRQTWCARGQEIVKQCRNKYSAESMAEGVITAVEDLAS